MYFSINFIITLLKKNKNPYKTNVFDTFFCIIISLLAIFERINENYSLENEFGFSKLKPKSDAEPSISL